MADRILHVSIGPVQGFVAQARRTRDLWAGSFLLSWLTGQLMATVLRQEGRVLFPGVGTEREPEDAMLAAILGRPLSRERQPSIGTLPNRFKASVAETFDPEAMADEARRKWRELAESVWRGFVASAAGRGRGTRTIWERQIDGFWEIRWVMGAKPDDGSDGAWLDARKNWRSHWPPTEGGDHCTAMGDWQELSGCVRSRERQKQDAFWSALRRKTGRLDLRDDERLCATALVKRLFPNRGQELERVIGWRIGTANWPSTAYMAAVPWLTHLASDPARCAALRTYVDTVRDAVDDRTFAKLCGERAVRLPGLEPLGKDADLDGNLFLEAALANPRATPLNDEKALESEAEDDAQAALRARLSKALAELGKEAGDPAQPFYALLLMDGDRLGKLLREKDGRPVSGALKSFVGRVPDIMRENNGVTVYAGGDDVLAMLPTDRAVDCAIALREAYGEAFKNLSLGEGKDAGTQATASAAVVFAHYRNPLREVLRLVHDELDSTAKAGNGRDSLALAVMSDGSVNHRWVGRFGALPKALVELRDAIAKDDQRQRYSASFFYRLRERYGAMLAEFEPDDQRAVVVAEYVKGSPPRDDDDRKRAETAVDVLLTACRTQRGDEAAGNDASCQLAGVFIARFLAEKNRFERREMPR